MPPELVQVTALGSEPTKQSPPAGVSIQDDLEFDILQTDVQGLVTGLTASTEMQAIGAKDPATWESVADRSYALLRDKSKDLRLASFLAVSMTYVRGFEGLHAGIDMVQGLLTNFWDTMQPPLKMLRGRVNAIDFISSKVAGESDEPGGRVQTYERKLIANYEATISGNPTLSERTAAFEELEVQTNALRAAMEAVNKLRDLLYEKFPADKIPSITSLREAGSTSLGNLDDFVRRNKPADPASAGGAPAASAGGAPAGGARPASPSGGAGASLGNVALDKPEELFRMFGRAGSMLRQADPSRAIAYRLNRWALWFDWDVEPPTTDGHMTRIPEPPSMEMEQPRALFAASNWMQLLNMCEERMGTAPVWLDRQFYIFTALSSMGPAFRPAAEAVRDETQQFLKRLPNLSKLAYASGMPFANDQTQQWIAQVVMVEGGGGGGGGAMGGGAGDESLAAALSEARALMNDGSYADAVRILQHGPPPPQSARSRYTWRMALAQLATDNGKARQAAPLWEELLSAIDQYQLETWEPELCLPVYRALWRVMKGDKTRVDAADAIFRRLCRLDPATALEG